MFEEPSMPFQEHFELVHVDNRDIFIPSSTDNSEQPRSKEQNLLLPCSSAASFNVVGSREPMYRPDLIKRVNAKPNLMLPKSVSGIYEHKLKQVRDASMFSSCLNGRIVDLEKKQVRIIDSQMNTGRIKGTDDHRNILNQETKFAIYNYGSTFLQLYANMPKDTDTVWAALLKQLNNVRLDRIEIIDEEDGVVKRKYKVHPSHRSNKECEEDCEILDLEVYRKGRFPKDYISVAMLPACVSHMQVHFNQLATLVNSILKGKNHMATIQFPVNQNSAGLTMIVWPVFLSELNQKIANREQMNRDDKLKLCSAIDENMTVSSDVNAIINSFEISISTATVVANLVKVHQHHFHEGPECIDCFPFKVPSNLTMVKTDLGAVSNNVFERITVAFEEMIVGLPAETFFVESEESLDDFLKHIKLMEGYSLVQDVHFYELKLPSYPVFRLRIDDALIDLQERLENNQLSAIYHRSISTTNNCGIEIVLRRPKLCDGYTLAYQPLILLAAKDRVELRFCGENQKQAADSFIQTQRLLPQELQRFSADHIEVSFEEAIWLIDPKKKLMKRNTKPIFLNTRQDKKLKFRVSTSSDLLLNFTNIEDGIELKHLEDMHDHYLERPGCDRSTLVQFLKWYKDDKEDDADEDQLPQLVETPLVVTSLDFARIPEKLPKFLVLKSGKRLALRKSPKIISYPTPEKDSDEYIRLNVTLYHPHRSYEELNQNMEEMRKIYLQKDVNPRKDGLGRELTQIETIRSILNPQLNEELWMLFEENY